jgi:hypothetical protein
VTRTSVSGVSSFQRGMTVVTRSGSLAPSLWLMRVRHARVPSGHCGQRRSAEQISDPKLSARGFATFLRHPMPPPASSETPSSALQGRHS